MRKTRYELSDEVLIESFWEEFYRVTTSKRGLILLIIKSRLGKFPEAADINYIVANCVADIERILKGQFYAKPGEIRNNKERARKLDEFRNDPEYLTKYVLEATRSFCRKKRNYWTHGKNKAKKELSENHKELRAGRAAREHGFGDSDQVHKWVGSLTKVGLGPSSMRAETIQEIDDFLRERGLNEKKVRCFWDRLEGYSFVQMAEQDPDESATPDKYRKRYRRLMERLESKSGKLRELLMTDFE